MSRLNWDEMKDGRVFNGFDYDLQCWVVNGVIQNCGHRAAMNCGCSGRSYAGKLLAEVA